MAASRAHIAPHVPVLLEEVLAGLELSRGGIIVDGTFGAGGYSRAILERSACSVVAIDRDPSVDVFAKPLVDEFGKRFVLLQGRFSDMQALLKANAITAVDGIVLDIGVSSMHIDQPARGFSYMANGALDMRMSSAGDSARDLVNDWSAEDLAHIFRLYSDERLAKRIANKIVAARADGPIETTFQLRAIVASAVGAKNEISSTSRVFQALRIAVNDELGELRNALVAAEILLSPGGRLCVVTFHSNEDRMVKRFVAERSGKNAAIRPSRHLPEVLRDGPAAPFVAVSRKAIGPSDAEIQRNSRARSAKLRIAKRTDAPGWGAEGAF
jgi:16S rRNA (cytosine1402-N4)-methyltransferase